MLHYSSAKTFISIVRRAHAGRHGPTICLAGPEGQAAAVRLQRRRSSEREFCLLKGIAEGTYNTRHAEAAA